MFAKQVSIFCSLLAVSGSAHALVGKTQPAGAAASHTVMVLKRQASGASFCSGVVIAPGIVLTAAHCVHRAKGVAVYVPSTGAPKLHVAASIAIHPGYVPNAIARRKRSIDLALIRLREHLPGRLRPISIGPRAAVRIGMRFHIAGYGMQREGVEQSVGKLRTLMLKVRPPISGILLWLRGTGNAAAGACTGDSGGPVFTHGFGSLAGITVWARGKGKRRCGDLTQAVLVAPHRPWINTMLTKWGRS